MEKRPLREIFLYEYKPGHTTLDASRKINKEFNKNTLNERTVKRWF